MVVWELVLELVGRECGGVRGCWVLGLCLLTVRVSEFVGQRSCCRLLLLKMPSNLCISNL